MEDLTFGEQVKIVLSRKKMTIKQLAELIELQTGQKMSRQNLTQRLGRDNFQEQDMRMIAAILGCSFTLNILSGAEAPAELQAERRTGSGAKTAAARAEDITEERDMTIGEIYEIHEELEQLEEKIVHQGESTEHASVPASQTAASEDTDTEPEAENAMAVDSGKQTEVQEITEPRAAAQEITGAKVEEPEAVKQESAVQIPEPVKPQSHTTHIFHPKQTSTVHVARPKRHFLKPGDPDFEPVVKHEDLAEDTVHGDINPYTGREYMTNSVRVHPKRIGYVQVYDRKEHSWTDMTEWAFLGYQERMKALLGKDYEPPIYLD